MTVLRIFLAAIGLSTMGLACADDEPTPPADISGLYALLPSPADLPPSWVMANPPHSVQAPEGPSGPPNARVQFELEMVPENQAVISCLEFYLVQASDETESREVFESLKQFLTSSSPTESQVKHALAAPLIGDETAAATLVSTVYEIGSCGTRSVFSYAGVTFRRETIVAEVIGATRPKIGRSPNSYGKWQDCSLAA